MEMNDEFAGDHMAVLGGPVGGIRGGDGGFYQDPGREHQFGFRDLRSDDRDPIRARRHLARHRATATGRVSPWHAPICSLASPASQPGHPGCVISARFSLVTRPGRTQGPRALLRPAVDCSPLKLRFARDSPLEEVGFEPLVPRDTTKFRERLAVFAPGPARDAPAVDNVPA